MKADPQEIKIKTIPAVAIDADCREFVIAIAEMTEGSGDIRKTSIIKPGVSIAREARRLAALIQR